MPDDVSFWKDIRAQFREIEKNSSIDPVASGVGRSPDLFTFRWTLSGFGKATNRVISEIEAIISEAGVHLDPNKDPTSAWLDRLVQERINIDRRGTILLQSSNGVQQYVPTARVERICDASVTLCNRLITRATGAPVKPEPAATATPPIQTLQEQLRSVLALFAHPPTYEEIADATRIDPTNVSRHLAGTTKPNRNHQIAYSRYFSKALKRNIVISKTQPKCS